MKTFKLIFLFLGLSTLLLSLVAVDSSTKSCPNGLPGTLVDATGLDGCGWLIELDNGTTLEPVGLSEFDVPLVDGKRIYVEYAVMPLSPSICMAGTKAKIKCLAPQNKQ
jgi:hypothetical protein